MSTPSRSPLIIYPQTESPRKHPKISFSFHEIARLPKNRDGKPRVVWRESLVKIMHVYAGAAPLNTQSQVNIIQVRTGPVPVHLAKVLSVPSLSSCRAN